MKFKLLYISKILTKTCNIYNRLNFAMQQNFALISLINPKPRSKFGLNFDTKTLILVMVILFTIPS